MNSCLLDGTLYLDYFLISLDLITESSNINVLSLEETIELVNNKRNFYLKKHPAYPPPGGN